jgi:hypothetical protein
MDGSETGVNYELFKDNVTTGVVITGTGGPVSFGYFQETGLYTAEAYTDHCSADMIGQIYVHMEPAPGQAGLPQGSESVCASDTADYFTAGASDAEDYEWLLDPEQAGTLFPDDDQVSVVWDETYHGMAYLSVYGMNDCGNGIPSDELEIAVNELPQPVVSGLDLVCNDDESEYSTPDNTGSSYDWVVTGGTIIYGAGTWQINVMWGNPGQGTVAVTETTAAGCEATSVTFEVTIDDCTGIGETSLDGVQIYPNPASDEIYITGLENASIRIFNLLGEEIYSIQKAYGDRALDISSFDNGIYLVKVEEASGLSVFRLVVR